MKRVTVLLDDTESERFSSYCHERGFKQSTLIARLVREHLDREGYPLQAVLFTPKGQKQLHKQLAIHRTVTQKK